MAHEVLPQHRPHDQLRTEAPTQRPQTDKYVSAFVTAQADVDVTFRSALLPKSADHFRVGIDELTVNFSNLSMLEYKGTSSVLLRVVRLGGDGEQQDSTEAFQMHDGPVGSESQWRDAFEFKVDQAYNTMQEILGRLDYLSLAVHSYMRAYGLIDRDLDGDGNADSTWANPQVVNGAATAFPANEPMTPHTGRHVQFSVTSNGEIKVSGSGPFWGNFAIEFPEQKYRSIFLQDINKRYVSLHPLTGVERNTIYLPINAGADYVQLPFANSGQIDFSNPPGDIQADAFEFTGKGNLFHTLDRRVTVEVGCSLPLKNSPMIDHGQEAPDFVLGRYMFHKPYSVSSNVYGFDKRIRSESIGVQTLQGAGDRVLFHHLKPQQKIQTFRLKLFARVRTYDEANDKWGMTTIVCPVQSSDYWHIRLHFEEQK
jgi:hypothetical protein